MSRATAAWATRLLSVPGAELVKRALLVAELNLQAGWPAFDAGLHGRAIYPYTRRHALATEVGEAYLQALTPNFAGLATAEHGLLDGGLEMLQFG